MGSSQSKRRSGGFVGEGRRLEHDSIVAAIASNRRQRKLLLRQMARQARREACAQLADSALYGEEDEQVCYAAGCQSAEMYASFASEREPVVRGSSASLDATVLAPTSDPFQGSHPFDSRGRPLFLNTSHNKLRAASNLNHPIYLPPAAATTTHGQANRDLKRVARRRRQANDLTQQQPLNGKQHLRQDAHATTISPRHHEEKLLAIPLPVNGKRQAALRRQLSREALQLQGADKGLSRREERRLRERSLQQDLQRQQLQSSSKSKLSKQLQQPHKLKRRQASHYETTERRFELFPVASARAPGSQSTSSQYSSQSHLTTSGSSNGTSGLHHYSSPEQNPKDPKHQEREMAAATQRSLAYTADERRRLRLEGLLPAAHQDQELQVRAVVNYIERCPDELSRYVYLRNLKDFNERLFYAALTANVEKLMPLVYTPTVGLACQRFSEIYMRPRGLYVTLRDAGRVGSLLANWPEKDVRVIVVTDGERILGLGDLGANGMGISIGKLSLYTALAGIPPANVLPVTIDVGTNNQQNLEDPFYIGLRQARTRGDQYYALVQEFMEAVVARWGRSCLIQFEDFANATAFELLQRYRHQFCTFNDDIQGTASVCLSGLISAAKLTGRRLADCSFLFYGAGEANLGTASLLVMGMREEGASEAAARGRIYLIDSKGLVVSSRADLSAHKRQFAQEAPHLRDLEEIIAHVRPSAIVGASAQGGAFTESICRKMAAFNERPIIFALSNPTSKAECTAQQAYSWTEGRCVFASGSPFEPVQFAGKTHVTGQGNNAYIFPGVGLAAIAAHVHSIPEDTFLVAARALSDQLTDADTEVGLIYPSLGKIRQVTLSVATRVLEHFYAERLATYRPEPDDKSAFLRSIQYDCRYEASPLPDSLALHQMTLEEK